MVLATIGMVALHLPSVHRAASQISNPLHLILSDVSTTSGADQAGLPLHQPCRPRCPSPGVRVSHSQRERVSSPEKSLIEGRAMSLEWPTQCSPSGWSGGTCYAM